MRAGLRSGSRRVSLLGDFHVGDDLGAKSIRSSGAAASRFNTTRLSAAEVMQRFCHPQPARHSSRSGRQTLYKLQEPKASARCARA